VNIHWATDYHGDGNSFGYAVHNDEARRALVRAGATIDPSAAVAVHVAPAHRFRPIVDKLNILYTAWESCDFTKAVREGIARADAVAVTARFLVEPFRRAAPGLPVEYCPLGVKHEEFPVATRSPPARGKPFRFLWLGACRATSFDEADEALPGSFLAALEFRRRLCRGPQLAEPDLSGRRYHAVAGRSFRNSFKRLCIAQPNRHSHCAA
jgi:hypothetical protein